MPPIPERKPDHILSTPQIRVLHALATSRGSMTRSAIALKTGAKTSAVVGRAIGYSNPERRLAFESHKWGGGTPDKPFPSLLTLGYVTESEIDIDGISEMSVKITDSGRKALEALGTIELSPMRDSYANIRDDEDES